MYTDYLIGDIATSEYASLEEAQEATATDDTETWGSAVAWDLPPAPRPKFARNDEGGPPIVTWERTARLEPRWYVCPIGENMARMLPCASRDELDRALFPPPPFLDEIQQLPDVTPAYQQSCVVAGDWLIRLRQDGRFEILRAREPLMIDDVDAVESRGCAPQRPEGQRLAIVGTAFSEQFSRVKEAIAAIRAGRLTELPFSGCWELPLGRGCSSVVRYRP